MALAQQTGQNVCKTPEFGSPLASDLAIVTFRLTHCQKALIMILTSAGLPPLWNIFPAGKEGSVMPKSSEELTNARKEEIINACASLYKTMGFKEITIRDIGAKTSFTRTSI